jgi:hypothetical protein
MGGRTQLRRFAARAGRAVPPAYGRAVAPAYEGGGPGLPATALPRLRAIAKSAASAYGDWRPAEVTAVPTTRARALSGAAPGDAAPGPGDTPVYLVTMTGHFTEGHGRYRRARPQARRYLSLVVNARSFWVMDTGLSRKAPPVLPASLGHVTNIAW